MGKVVKGLIAAAIPIAVIVGIASCGHRPVVMVGADSQTTQYTFNAELPETIKNTITTNINQAVGETINPRGLATTTTTWVAPYKNSLCYLRSFKYSFDANGIATVYPNTFNWEIWDGSYYASNGRFATELINNATYFLYAYASTTTSIVEKGANTIFAYNTATSSASSPTSALHFSYYPDVMNYTWASGENEDMRLSVPSLKRTLEGILYNMGKQTDSPLVNGQAAYNQGWEQGYNDGLSDGRTDGYDDGFIDGRNQGYQTGYVAGQNSVTSESTAINNLFASLVSVPINVLNGLMPMAIWNTPIISIMITFMLLAMLMWLIRKLLAR